MKGKINIILKYENIHFSFIHAVYYIISIHGILISPGVISPRVNIARNYEVIRYMTPKVSAQKDSESSQ